MTSIFEGQPPKTRPKFQSKQGAPFGFQVYIYIAYEGLLLIHPFAFVAKSPFAQLS